MAIKRITTNLIKDSDIATVDIANNAITAAKITDGNITTAKLADLSVTAGKLAATLDLTGKTITVATATTGDNDTSPASTAFVQQEIAALVDSSPDSLNTLNELAAALGDDASFSTTVTNSIATKLPLAGGTMTGDLKMVNSSGATLDINSNASAADSKILLHEGTSASPANGASIRYDGTNNLFKIGVGSSVDTTRLTIARDTGNVGIGASSPQDTLHVITDSSTTNDTVDVARIEATSSGTPAVGFGPTIDFRGERGSASSDSMGRIGYVADVMTASRIDGAFVVETAIDGTYSEHLRVSSSGNVGIGNNNPTSAKLEVKGAKTQSGGAPIGNILIADSTSLAANTGGGITFQGIYQTGGAITGFASIEAMKETATHNEYGGALVFKSREDQGSMNEGMRLTSTGNVGIGTTSPDGELHVLGTGGGNGDIYVERTSGAKIHLQAQSANGKIGTSSNHNLGLNTNGTTRLTIDTNGNVGIGTTSPNSYSGQTALTINSSGVARLDLDISNTMQGYLVAESGYTGLYAESGNNLRLGAGGAERMRIDASGNLFLNTTSAMDACFVQFTDHSNGEAFLGLSSKDDNNVGIRFGVGTTRKWVNYRDTSNNLIWYDNAAAGERMRIDSSGNLLVGTATHRNYSGGTTEITLGTDSAGDTTGGAITFANGNGLISYLGGQQSSTTLGTYTATHLQFNTNNTERMRIDSSGHLILGSNISTTEAGKLSVYTDATNDAAIYGYRSTSEFRIVPFLSNGAYSSLSAVNDSGLFFSDNFVIAKAASGDYGMKVFGNGNVSFGTGTAQSKYTFQGDTTSDIITVKSGNNTNTNVGMILFRDSGNTYCGQITANGSTHTTAYLTSSDYRLKENISYEFNALDRIAQLKPARFNWISDETNTLVDGFLAHEVSDIVPEAINGEKDATREEEYEVTPARYEDDGETLISEAVMGTRTVPVYQGIDQSKLVPLLTKAIQEQQTIIDDLKSRLDEAGL